MTTQDFQELWISNYLGTPPLSYLFKEYYRERWFRIHSLPESKRYADNKSEWEVLLSRQNEIITDMLGLNTSILLVAADYSWRDEQSTHATDEEEVYKAYSFVKLDQIELHKISPEHYDEQNIYRPAFSTTTWNPNCHDNILRKIATDDIRAFFVSFDKNVIIAPYDGGVDFVLKDTLTKEDFKFKYKEWLSDREDGL